jgi:hypothetical protein
MLLPDQIRFDTSTLSYLMELLGDAPTLPMAVTLDLVCTTKLPTLPGFAMTCT